MKTIQVFSSICCISNQSLHLELRRYAEEKRWSKFKNKNENSARVYACVCVCVYVYIVLLVVCYPSSPWCSNCSYSLHTMYQNYGCFNVSNAAHLLSSLSLSSSSSSLLSSLSSPLSSPTSFSLELLFFHSVYFIQYFVLLIYLRLYDLNSFAPSYLRLLHSFWVIFISINA